MVSAARKEARKDRESVEKRNEQLQAQLNDAELLLASHQEQLSELKIAMQEMSTQRNDLEVVANASTSPSTPALDTNDHMNKIFDVLHLSPTIPGGDEVAPAPPTTFTHLLVPVLRNDVQAYEDFSSLMEISRKSGPPSRITSGSYTGLSGLGLSNLSKGEQSQISSRMPSNGSTSSLSGSNAYHSSPSTPNLPPSANSSMTSRDTPMSGTPLKETSFYKRVLVEDIEPTLRLDIAPGLSWLARRSVVSSMCDGRLIVEPVPSAAKQYQPPCSLCGEQGRSHKQTRNHRFRTSESESAQRYLLCEYCLSRVRSTCDFLGFLRMIKEGHWRIDGSHAEAAAWEESVRLRERMFWSRIGGGVIPAFLRTQADSPRTSVEEEKNSSSSTEPEDSCFSPNGKLNQPSPLSQEVGCVQDESSIFSAQAEAQSSTSSGTTLEGPLAQEVDIAADYYSPQEISKDPSQDLDRAPLSSISTRPSSINASDKTTKKSVAQRAALFETTSPEDVAASTQLQTSLQASIGVRSPVNGRSISPAARLISSEADRDRLRAHKLSGFIPGAFDF